MNHTLSVSASLTSAQGWPSTVRKVSGLKINYYNLVIFSVLCFVCIFIPFIDNCNNHRQVLNQLHAQAYNIVFY